MQIGKTMMLKSILSAVFLSKYLIPYKAHKIQSYEFKYIKCCLR